MRCVAIALGISVCNVASAQNPATMGQYQAPSKWNNFNIVPPQQPAMPQQAPMPQQATMAQQSMQPNGYLHTVSTGGPVNAPQQNTTEILPAPKGVPATAAPSKTAAPQAQPQQPKPAQPQQPQPHAAGPQLNSPGYAPQQPQPAQPNGSVPYATTGGQPGLACPPGASQGYSQPGVHQPPTQWTTPQSAADMPLVDGSSPYTGPQPHFGSGFTTQGFAGQNCNTGACATPISRPNLAPWYGSFNLLFWQMETNHARRLIAFDTGYDTIVTTGIVDPGSTLGYDVTFGRYLDCGRYGLSATYMNFDPSQSETIVTAGSYYAPMASWNNISIDPNGAGVDTVYDLYDNAAAYRVRRNVQVQGIEVNLTSFGLMGAQRAAAMCSQGACGGVGANLGLGLVDPCNGYGGATGPLVRACSGRVRVQTSHGFRWFQFKDDFEFAANIDGSGGYQATDLYYNIDVENNMFGYQYGSMLTYCLNERCNLGIGGKFGIYGNRAEMSQRIGTASGYAYETTMPSDFVNTNSSDTVLAGLGEIDLGLGYRLNNAWTVRGGYRLLGATGVATSTDSLDQDYSSVSTTGGVYANDSLLLHGAYVGMNFNW
ncbi:signal peptide protein [Rhodopirellula maiorica SM1]|uniref:Signal peptide protein n=2 Tax=Novipirellula TaxID=2795426 RepID=M5RZL6_9BACT|nr:signal peptide protein [Rhodopirellula maiorica SM1]